jgi:hypothetical protein
MALALIALYGCTSSDQPRQLDESYFTVPPPPPGLVIPCSGYRAAFDKWVRSPDTPESDFAYAEDLEAVAAGSALGTELEVPLRQMAAAFRAGQLEIEASEVLASCSGEQVPTP